MKTTDGAGKMLSQIPVNLVKIGKKWTDMEILRAGIIAELDAINLYEQLAATTENEDLKKVLLEIAKEEKTHVGEFQALLLKVDKHQLEELKKGAKEVEELTGK
jgi:rubrerythrin